ncbi:hypothetical protein QAD02_000274 [Eretmocerus hayati]|uniref:Uncharacterized protein n=1 Tax=Eretmocerus hayati TaxID=131215 RepID=A0ACC2NHH1_9HYME|nr:hypothetical protein QAD02_000274 [Eretmocerus hayati]
MIDKLKGMIVKHYINTPKNERLKCMVLEGINKTFIPLEIRQELRNTKIQDVKMIKVNKIEDNPNRSTEPLLVQLTAGSSISDLARLEKLAHQKIKRKGIPRRIQSVSMLPVPESRPFT